MCEQPTAFGIHKLISAYAMAETVERLRAAIISKGVTLFTQIDHQALAHSQQLALPPTQLLIFGHPKLGTALMNSAISTGLDLPLKVLVTQACDDQVWVYFNQPDYLQLRHGLAAELLAPVLALQQALADNIHAI